MLISDPVAIGVAVLLAAGPWIFERFRKWQYRRMMARPREPDTLLPIGWKRWQPDGRGGLRKWEWTGRQWRKTAAIIYPHEIPELHE